MEAETDTLVGDESDLVHIYICIIDRTCTSNTRGTHAAQGGETVITTRVVQSTRFDLEHKHKHRTEMLAVHLTLNFRDIILLL